MNEADTVAPAVDRTVEAEAMAVVDLAAAAIA